MVRSSSPLKGLKLRPEPVAKTESHAEPYHKDPAAAKRWEDTLLSGGVDDMMERAAPLKGLKLRAAQSGGGVKHEDDDDAESGKEDEAVEDFTTSKSQPHPKAARGAVARVSSEMGSEGDGDIDEDESEEEDDGGDALEET